MADNINTINTANNVESDIFENVVLDWIRTITVFFIASIALYSFTPHGKAFAIISLLITIILVTTLIVDYIVRRNEEVSRGHSVRFSLDVLIATMMLALALIIWMLWTVVLNPEPIPMSLSRAYGAST